MRIGGSGQDADPCVEEAVRAPHAGLSAPMPSYTAIGYAVTWTCTCTRGVCVRVRACLCSAWMRVCTFGWGGVGCLSGRRAFFCACLDSH